MSKIRSKNTKAELLVFRELRKRKIYFQKHYKKALGCPDIAIPRKKIAVFIDGDFWHGKNFKKIKNRLPRKYWKVKIEANVARDNKNRTKLRRQGWKILRVWVSDISKNKISSLIKIGKFIKNRK